MNSRRILAVVYKEWREIVRDRLFLSLAFVVPVSLLFVSAMASTLMWSTSLRGG